jgi:hypothetical protein
MKSGDAVFALVNYDIVPGEVVKVNRKSITVHLAAYKCFSEHVSRIRLEKIILTTEPFTVVWNMSAGKNGRGSYYITTTEFPNDLKIGWRNTNEYVWIQNGQRIK